MLGNCINDTRTKFQNIRLKQLTKNDIPFSNFEEMGLKIWKFGWTQGGGGSY